MARIPDEQIDRLKQKVSVQRLAEGMGITCKRHGTDLLGLCPFHSGRRVDYARNRAGELLSISTTWQGQTRVLASRLAYRPFGPLSGMDYGNGLVRRQAYDPGGRLTRLLSGPGVQDLRYAYDQADNLIARHDGVSPVEGRGYAYDALNRLEEVSGAGLDLYTYDALGNRMSRATAERLEHYRYDAESGRLQQRIPDRAYDYDAGGRTTADGRWRYRYGADGRLAEITRVSTGQRQAAYRYNALGERVRKVGTSVTYYHYDLEGRLLAETDASGQTRAEYLYLGNEPLVLSRSGQLYYYHNDHLGMPQKLTDGAGQVVWSARYRAFGEASIGAGYVTQNLRFPGQYYDEESGLHYNYQRYYDPDMGRYLTSDPIGLAGRMNTYGYANQNPIMLTDPLGLRASYCQRPLGDFTGENGDGPPIFNHQFICVTLEDGTVRCDSQNNPDNDPDGPLWPTPGVPSLPERDNEQNSQCENIDDDEDRCFEQCVLGQWEQRRPNYAVGPLGTDCQEYSRNIVAVCRQQCAAQGE